MMKTISYNEYLQLIALLTLGDESNRQLRQITNAAIKITGEKEEMGHTADAIYDGYATPDIRGRVKVLLSRLEISVDEELPYVDPRPVTAATCIEDASQLLRDAAELGGLSPLDTEGDSEQGLQKRLIRVADDLTEIASTTRFMDGAAKHSKDKESENDRS